jgi:BTB/POZ domain-containing protein KCTD9
MRPKLLLDKCKKYILVDPIRTSLFLFFVCLLVVIILTISTTSKGYSKDFYENILVEAHGMLFDILILGVLLYWMNKFGEKHREIEKLKDELHYYCEYNQPEATFHVSKIIRQLNKLGVYDITLVRVFLEEASLLGNTFDGSKFIGNWLNKAFFHTGEFTNCSFVKSECVFTNFTEAELSFCKFIDCDLNMADFTDASLHKVEFTDCNLAATLFANATLSYCDFSKSTLSYTVFDGASLTNCNLTDYKLIEEVDFTSATIQNCKILKKDLPFFKDATLLDNEVIE